jgi:hypothetical protein
MTAAETVLFTTGDWVAITTAAVLAGAALARAELLARSAISAASEAKKAAKELADEAERSACERIDDVKRIALEAHTQAAAINGALSMFRERVASDYVNREMMRELEARLSADMDRISASIENTGRTIGASVEKLAERLNRVLEGRGGKQI